MKYEFPHFTIDKTDYLKGGNTFENYPDGGMTFDYYGYNVFAKPGWITGNPSNGSTVDASLVKNPGISWAQGKGAISQEIMCVGVDANDAGTYYTMTEATGALTAVGSVDSASDYQLGFVSSVYYKGSFYTTTKTDIVKNSTDLATRVPSWWQTTESHGALDQYALHPQVVYGDIHYIADGRYIHQNDNGTTQVNVLDLGADWAITSMVVYNNLIYIAAEPYYNFSSTAHGGAKIFTWNGYADSWLDEYEVDLRITAMRVWRNTMYVWTKDYMGYFNGGTVKPLYPLGTVVYPSQVTTTKESLWFADGYIPVRYGSPYLRGQPRFHRHTSFNPNVINGMIGNYNNGLVIATTGTTNGSNHFVSDVNVVGAGTFAFNTRVFSRPVKIRGYVINTSSITSGKLVTFSYLDESGTTKGSKDLTFSTTPNVYTYRHDVHGEKAVTRMKPVLYVDGCYVKSIDVLYEPSDWKHNN